MDREEEEGAGALLLVYLAPADIFLRNSSLIFQLATFPFTNPATITKRRTRILIAVKNLFTQADSFTPKDNSPMEKEKALMWALDPYERQCYPDGYKCIGYYCTSIHIFTFHFFNSMASSVINHLFCEAMPMETPLILISRSRLCSHSRVPHYLCKCSNSGYYYQGRHRHNTSLKAIPGLM